MSATMTGAAPQAPILRALVPLMGMQQPGERLKALGKAFRDPIRSLGAIGSYLAGRAKRTVTMPVFTRVQPSLSREAETDVGCALRAPTAAR